MESVATCDDITDSREWHVIADKRNLVGALACLPRWKRQEDRQGTLARNISQWLDHIAHRFISDRLVALLESAFAVVELIPAWSASQIAMF